jgi:hypothetical protein
MAKIPKGQEVLPTVELDDNLLRAGLSVLVVVVRGDGKIVKQVPWTTAVSRLIGSFLRKLPKKRFGQDKRDERLSEVLQLAGAEERKRYLSIGLRPGTWM